MAANGSGLCALDRIQQARHADFVRKPVLSPPLASYFDIIEISPEEL